MAKGGNYVIENTYLGGYSSLDPNKAYSNSFTGYRSSVNSLGITTNPATANQIKEVSDKLSAGLKNIEVEFVSSEIFDAVPKQQLTEIRQIGKLLGSDVSVHAPVIDSVGIDQRSGQYNELNRELAERRITDALLRSHELNPDGNIMVNFHTTEGMPSSEWKTLGEPGKEREAKRLLAIDKDSGKIISLETEKRFYPEKDLSKPLTVSPEENIRMTNETDWYNKISQLFFTKERADEILQQNEIQIRHLLDDLNQNRINPKTGLTPTQENAYMKYKDAELYLEEMNKQARSIFSRGYEHGDDKQKEILRKISDEYKEEIKKSGTNIFEQSNAVNRLLMNLKETPGIAPEMFVPLEKFAADQSAKTFGNAIFNAYDKFKDPNKTPLMLIENPPAGFGLSTGEDLKNIVIKSREHFVERIVNEKNINRKEAEQIAEKLIGATWDVGHINMLRKQGFSEKDIIKETEKVAPFVKHVHLSDNFGFEHTELPMGMGNVPMKEIMARLGEKGFEGKKIIEASSWWQHMKTPPIKESLEGLGSPMYSTGPGPYWNQALGLQQGYFTGYGIMLPSNNYQTFGGGFSQLPGELGGEVQRGSTGRFSQRSME